MLRKIISLAVILSFVFSNVSFVFAGSNLRTMSSAETETVSGLRKDLWSGGLPAKSPAAAVTKVTAPTTKFDSILATAIPELREAARIILDDSGVQLFNPSVYMEEEGAQIRIAISDPTDSFNEAGFIISKGIQYIGYRISPFHGSYEYAGGTTLDYNKFIELVKEVLKKEKEHPYWGEWTTAVTDKRMRATKPAPVKEFATTGLTGKTPTGVGPAMGMGSDPNRVSNTIADLNRALEDGVVHVVSDSYRAEKVEDAIKELRKIALHSATSLQDLARIAEAIKQTQNRFETYALGYEEYLRTHREAFSPDAQRQEYDRLWKSDQRDEAERYLAEVNAAPKDSRGWYIYKTCVSALAEIEPRLITLAKSTQTSAEDFPHERPTDIGRGVGPAMGDGGTAAGGGDDYADTGNFGQGERNKIFGLEAQPVKGGTLGLKTVGKELVAPDLDAGLLNIPGARYYLWNGNELRYFIAKKVRRYGAFDEGDQLIVDQDGPVGDEEVIKEENENAELLQDFLSKNKIKYPCYIFEFIPRPSGSLPILGENDRYFYAGDEKQAYATRLANMPVLPIGLIKHNPYIALAKMAHERAAFEAKLQGKSGDEQHAAGLDAEFHSVELMNLKDKELSDEARKELINLLNNISEELIRLGNVRKDLEENKVFGKTGGDYSDSAPAGEPTKEFATTGLTGKTPTGVGPAFDDQYPTGTSIPTSAEKQAARDTLISVANAVDTGVLSSEIKAEKIFTDFGITKEGKSGLILSIDAVAEGPGAALIGLAKRGVRVILYEDGTKRSQALINIRKELNQQIKDPSNQIAMAFSLEGALELLSQERIDHITYIGTEEEINQLTEEVKKRMNVIKTVKEIIEALGQIENMSRMLDDFKSACVRLGLV